MLIEPSSGDVHSLGKDPDKQSNVATGVMWMVMKAELGGTKIALKGSALGIASADISYKRRSWSACGLLLALQLETTGLSLNSLHTSERNHLCWVPSPGFCQNRNASIMRLQML